MQDGIQRVVQALAYSDGFTRDAAVVCAVALVFAMAAGWLLMVYRRRAELTLATCVRIAVLFVAAYLIAKGLGHVIHDPRPYLVEHLQPLIPLAHDNGFPSDHSLLAWVLALSLAWLAPLVEEQDAVLGADPWVYGVEPNRRPLEALIGYAFEQACIPARPAVESLFAESTRGDVPAYL